MSDCKLPIGCCVSLSKPSLQAVIDHLRGLGFRVVGPRVADGAVIYDDVSSISQLPLGVIDEQDGGRYRLRRDDQAGYFDHVVGPHSVKQFLFPPTETLQEFVRIGEAWQQQPATPAAQPLAVLGARSCDLHAIAIQDRVFLQGPYVDPGYRSRREQLFLIAVQCRRAAATCFCHSMQTGPHATSGFDLALTELDDQFVIEVGSDRGGEVLAGVTGWRHGSLAEVVDARRISTELEDQMRQRGQEPTVEGQPRPRQLATDDIHDLLLDNLTHPRWQDVAERCLSCANCTLVCPTCFCSSVTEITDLTGEHVRRERSWASCFTAEHSAMNSGVARQSTTARYRQWLTHKLATWIDQYGTSGCVGCGRCITWCPVGIDLTEEVAAIRKQAP